MRALHLRARMLWRMKILLPLLLWLSGLSFLGFGIAFLFDPVGTLLLAGVATEGAIAATELRAFYGGVEVALGALLLFCATRATRWRDGLWLTLICYGAIGVTRVAGMAMDGSDSFFLRFAASTEIGFAVLAIIALRVCRSGPYGAERAVDAVAVVATGFTTTTASPSLNCAWPSEITCALSARPSSTCTQPSCSPPSVTA